MLAAVQSTELCNMTDFRMVQYNAEYV